MTTNAIHPDLPPADWVSKCGRFVLYRGDCLDVLPKIPKGAVDAVVTDPPYGIAYDASHDKYKNGIDRGACDWDVKTYEPSPMLGFDRVVLWGGNCFASRLPDNPGWLCWLKTARNGADIRQADMELAWTNFIRRPQTFQHLWIGAYKASESGIRNVHPTQKPIAVMKWCVGLASDTNEVVADFYMGSGTTGVACVKTGRRFIGVEIDDHYFNVARKRIEQAITDYNGGPMFENVEPQNLYEGKQQ